MSPVVITARVKSMAAGGEAEALAFEGGKILAVGDRAEVERIAGPRARHIQAGGLSVLPGFIDAHHHVSIGALYGGAARLDPPKVFDIPSLQAALAEAGRALPAGRFLVAMNWDERQLRERRPPTLAELDDAVPDRPLFALHQTCHRALANSRALTLAGIDASTPEPSGGTIVRGPGRLPSGLLIERGMSRVERLARPDLAKHDAAGILDRIAAHYRGLVRVGITRVVDAAVPAELMALYRESARRGDVLIPTHVMPVSTTGYLEEPWDALDGDPTGKEEGPFTVGPVKLVFDGAPGCSMCLSWWQVLSSSVRTFALSVKLGSWDPVRTMASAEPRMGTQVRTGIAIYRHEEATRVVRGILEKGFAVATHAIGNAAIEVALDAYQAAGARLHDAGVPRIEHASFSDRELMQRMAGMGIAVVAQPGMLAMPMLSSAASIPGLPFFGLRWLLDAGVLVAGSSDFPVDVFDPLVGMRVAVTRENARGAPVERDQRISLDEALTMYTKSAAKVAGCLDRTGTLEVGKRADFAVVEGFEGTLRSARTVATVVGGAPMFGEMLG